VTGPAVPDGLLAEVRADLEAGGERAARWRPAGAKAFPLLPVGEEADTVQLSMNGHAWALVGSAPSTADLAAGIEKGTGPRPAVGDRILISFRSDRVEYPPVVGICRRDVGYHGIEVTEPNGETWTCSEWAILPAPWPTVPDEAAPGDPGRDGGEDTCSHLHEMGVLRSRSADLVREVEAIHERQARLGAVIDRQIAREREVTAKRDRAVAEVERLTEQVGRLDSEVARLGLAAKHGIEVCPRCSVEIGMESSWEQVERLRAALRQVLNFLGPKNICTCLPGDETCGLREESAGALQVARDALATGVPVPPTGDVQ
jgi:hypothetical protein